MTDLIRADSSFELVTSSRLQTLRLFYEHNIVTMSKAIIFVTTELVRKELLSSETKIKGIPWNQVKH